MFDPHPSPRLFGLPLGADFARALVDGLRARMADAPPEAMARVTLFVNTTRMKRRVSELFDGGGATFLPRLRLVTDLGQDAAMADLPPAVSPLRRKLELARLVADLIDRDPSLAPRHAIFGLAESLAALMDEMQGEGFAPEALEGLDLSRHAAHWTRSLTFIRIVERFFGQDSGEPPDVEARQRLVIERTIARWAEVPPTDPVIVAGSTGSRGATGLLLEAVARLPQGAVILPGVDWDMPEAAWQGSDDALTAEDHPQYRFRRLTRALGLRMADIQPWQDTPAPAPRRNAFVSLALRPAPVTDQWQSEGPRFTDIAEAMKHVSLIEAESPRDEAAAIAIVLRDAAERGVTAALITPDRMLTRQVTAALDRWGIRPDDSAGQPLPLSAPGRLLGHVAAMRGARITGVELLTLLKHPLTHTGDGRGDHLRHTRDLELTALRGGMPFPSPEALLDWVGKHEDRRDWATWVGRVITDLAAETAPLVDHVAQTREVAEMLASGSGSGGPDELWAQNAGREALRLVTELAREAEHGGEMTPAAFRDLFNGILNTGTVRSAAEPHPQIKIWGTLEARVGGADLVILAGLNDGIWPSLPAPDPWMNRQMRHDAGLLLPERRIGLAAHDFQQAIGAPEVILTRAVRDAEAETVPSRWINRMMNLLSGMSEAGEETLKAMKERGNRWRALARELDRPQSDRHRADPAPRPAPQPPIAARPTELSFTQVARLIRDPYSIYAQKILDLSPLDPLSQSADAPLRGTAIHEVMERFHKEQPGDEGRAEARARLLATAADVFETQAPWPAVRALWLAKLARIADDFLAEEAARQDAAVDILTEQNGRADFGTPPMTIKGRADRIDLLKDGRIALFDYKTGTVPTAKQQKAYDKQLLLEALVAEAGGFAALGRAETSHVAYIGLGSKAATTTVEADAATLARTRDELEEIIADFAQRERGYTSRRVVFRAQQGYGGDYDHLARYGEWDHTDEPVGQEVGE